MREEEKGGRRRRKTENRLFHRVEGKGGRGKKRMDLLIISTLG